MKKFVFTLAKVLDYKDQLLEVLKNEMALLEAKFHELESRIAALEEEFRRQSAELRERLDAGLAKVDAVSYEQYLAELNRRIRQLELQKTDLLRAISAKRQEIVAMNSDISGLERLRDKQLAEYMLESRKEQERTIEEFVERSRFAG